MTYNLGGGVSFTEQKVLILGDPLGMIWTMSLDTSLCSCTYSFFISFMKSTGGMVVHE